MCGFPLCALSDLCSSHGKQNGGVSYFGVLWGLILGNWLTSLLKSRTLLIPMARKGMGLTDLD